MNAVRQPRQGQRSWKDAQRAEQAQKLRTRKIWLASTGPRTANGKLKSSQKSYTDLLRFYTKQEDRLSSAAQNAAELRLDFFENELIDIERQICGGLRFTEIIGNSSCNIIPFPTTSPLSS